MRTRIMANRSNVNSSSGRAPERIGKVQVRPLTYGNHRTDGLSLSP
jgi:hypothetical protein